MSKPVKNLITDNYKRRFDGVSGAVLVDVRGMPSNKNNEFRNALAGKSIKVTVVKNALARRAFEGTDLDGLREMIDGPSAVIYPVDGDQSVVNVARELIDWAKKLEHLQFRGAILDGIKFGPDQIDALSKYPTRDEAQAKVVTMLLSPARNLVGAVTAPAGNIAGILKTIQEKLEKGEAIARVS